MLSMNGPPYFRSMKSFALLVVSRTIFAAMRLASDEWMPRSDVDARVERIVDGLLPAAVIKGHPLPRMTLAERMKYHNVPEVSIAFFENGRVAWARGYGLADPTINKPVTPGTFFQAASISKSVTTM
jgi:CubicO group peptidase (beta-lactamase class C family)